MQYNQLEYLVHTVRYGSIGKAAKAMGVAQPNISQAIINLENEFRMRILNRSNKGVTLTQEGKAFYAMASDIVKRTEALKDTFKERTEKPAMQLSFATFPSQISLEALQELPERTGGISCHVTMRNLTLSQTIESVRRMESEIGIILVSTNQQKKYDKKFRENGIEYERLSVSNACINMSENHPLAKQKNFTYSELIQYPLARFIEDDLSLLDYTVSNNKSEYGFKDFNKVYFFDSDCSIINFIRQSNAVKIGYSWNQHEYARLGIICLPIIPFCQLDLGWIKRKNDSLSPEASLFIKIMKEKYEQYE